MRPIVSEQYEYVIGVDTHAATHTFALVAAATRALQTRAEFPTSPAGLSRAQGWLQQRVSGRPTLVVVEGTGSFGAIVTERFQRAGLSVVEAARMPAGDRRGIGKKNRVHFDLATTDLGSETERLQQLGATIVRGLSEGGNHWVTMAEGNEFDLISI